MPNFDGTFIPYSCFFNCNKLTTLVFGNTDYAGERKNALPAGLNKIDGYAFAYCTSLTEITFNYNLTNIGRTAFYNNTKLNVYYNQTESYKNANMTITATENENILGTAASGNAIWHYSDCSHPAPYYEEWFENDNETHDYYRYCYTCGDLLEYIADQLHTYPTGSSQCACGYSTCAHPSTTSVYVDKDETYHTNIITCNICGEIVLSEPYEHLKSTTYVNDGASGHRSVTTCAYDCGYSKTGAVEAVHAYENLDVVSYRQRESSDWTYHDEWKSCSKCGYEAKGGKVRHDYDPDPPYTESQYAENNDIHFIDVYCKYCNWHDWENNGDHTFDPTTKKCTVCGRKCNHKDANGNFVTEIEYGGPDDTATHWYQEYCPRCDTYVVAESRTHESIWTGEYYNNTYDSTLANTHAKMYRCPCGREWTDYWYDMQESCTYGSPSNTYEKDANGHWRVKACTVCKNTVKVDVTSHTMKGYYHSDSTCTICSYKCTATTTSGYVYVYISSSQHTYYTKCSVCLKPKSAGSSSSHSGTTTNGVTKCSYCGSIQSGSTYTCPHSWDTTDMSNVDCYLCSATCSHSSTATKYVSENSSQHATIKYCKSTCGLNISSVLAAHIWLDAADGSRRCKFCQYIAPTISQMSPGLPNMDYVTMSSGPGVQMIYPNTLERHDANYGGGLNECLTQDCHDCGDYEQYSETCLNFETCNQIQTELQMEARSSETVLENIVDELPATPVNFAISSYLSNDDNNNDDGSSDSD